MNLSTLKIATVGICLVGLASCSSPELSPTVEIVPTVDLDSTVQALVEQTAEAEQAFETAVAVAIEATKEAVPTAVVVPTATVTPTAVPVPTATVMPTATTQPTPTLTPTPTLIPNQGSLIAFSSDRFFDGNFGLYQIYVMDIDGSNQRALINNPGNDLSPYWSIDGTQLTFSNVRYSIDGASWSQWVINLDGTGLTTYDEVMLIWSSDNSPDGQKRVFTSGNANDSEIFVSNIDGTGLTRLTSNQYEDGHPSWSPDGSQIAFHSNRDGNFEIYVMDSDGSNQIRLTNNTASDFDPAWSP